MGFTLALSVLIVAGIHGAPEQIMSVKQISLAGDRCTAKQMLLESDCVDLPKVLKKPEPKYPHLAARASMGANVSLTASLDPKGKVADIRVTHFTGDPNAGFQDAATKALASWRFQPALLHGKP